MDWRLLAGTAALGVIAAGAGLYHLLRKQEDPEQQERHRRAHLNQVGRIAEGQVVEILEMLASPALQARFSLRRRAAVSAVQSASRRLVRYSYAISGVTYETAQDVTGMEERLCLERLAAGQPASVKYDPSNPTNSILVADDWSGLH